jgi:hypothetical protein
MEIGRHGVMLSSAQLATDPGRAGSSGPMPMLRAVRSLVH